MNLSRLIYFSEVDSSKSINTRNIIDVSKRNNIQSDVTGLLYSDNGYFVQALEGRRSQVTKTYNRIATDPRHHNIYMVSCTDVRERMFGGWSMALHNEMSESVREQLTGFFSLNTFDPENITAESLVYFLQILAMDVRKRDGLRAAQGSV